MSSVYYATVPPTPVGVLQTPISANTNAGVTASAVKTASQSAPAPPNAPEYDDMKYYNDFIRQFYAHRIGTNNADVTKPKEQQTLTTAAASNAAVDVDFAARFDRLERMLEAFNPDATMLSYDASENARLDYLTERFDRFEEKLEDLLVTQGNTHKNELDELNARFDRLEQRMAAVDLNGATQACSSCDGLTITVKHGGSR
ncbi:hypothetical protein ONZ45_g10753 [Pleurotus djamor]|nr:hypothetical protein ONZ45_g10753 [Pleurotus djamor]